MSYDPRGSQETTNIGALADGFAASAINSTEVDDGSTGYVGGLGNGSNRDNTQTINDNDTTKLSANENGDNRDNSYDWDYKSSTTNLTHTDTDIKNVTDIDTNIKTEMETNTATDSYNHSDDDWSYSSNTNTNTNTQTDSSVDSTIVATSDSFNTHMSSTSSEFGVLHDIKDVGNVGVAGGDLTFNLGDDYSFTLDIGETLNNSLGGDGNDTGFSAVQASHLADQDYASNISMNNEGAINGLLADGGKAHSGDGIGSDGEHWDLSADNNISGSSTANASAIVANSGFHFEFVQGANLLTNTLDSSVVGGNADTTTVSGHSEG